MTQRKQRQKPLSWQFGVSDVGKVITLSGKSLGSTVNSSRRREENITGRCAHARAASKASNRAVSFACHNKVHDNILSYWIGYYYAEAAHGL